MKQTSADLIQWHNRKFRGRRREIDKLTKQIKSSTNRPPSDEAIQEEQNIRESLNKLLEQEETF